MASGKAYDAIIIGGGHNGLVCACYLAAAGMRVRVLERRSVVGGAAVTEEFHPGFRNSVASYTVSLLNPKVIEDLRLHEHGLEILDRPMSNFLPLADDRFLKIGGGLEATRAEFARYSQHDADALPGYYDMLEGVADVLRDMVLETPVNVGGGLTDVLRALKLGSQMKRLTMNARRDVLDMFTKSAAEILDGWFENEHIKAVFAFDAVVGNYADPRTPGSAYVLLHHVFGEVNGKKGNWGHAVGGMGAITQAMRCEAEARGVEISTDATVARVRVRQGRVEGVDLENGERIDGKRVISGINPKLLYLDLIEPEHLDSDFLRRMRSYRCGSATFRMNVALSELPDFTCAPGTQQQDHHGAGIIFAPTMQYMEMAYQDARQFGWSKHPVVEMLIPSTIDDGLAPKGQHVASLFCQHFDPQLPDGKHWDECREQAADAIIDTVTAMAPNFRDSILGTMMLSPMDLERTFGLVGGDIFHGALSLDQLYSARPLLGYGDYRGPMKGLYMCGSGTHPGGGVTGAPGHNAAQEILRDRRWRR